MVISLKPPPPKPSVSVNKYGSSKKYMIEPAARPKSKTVKNVLSRGAMGQQFKKPTGTMTFDLPEQKYYKIGGWEHDNPSFNEFDEICSNSDLADTPPVREVKTSWGQRNYLQPKYV